MHTIRIKELKGRSWVKIIEDTFKLKDEAELVFMGYVHDYSEDYQSGLSITWSQGKKVLGVFRVQ